MTVRPAQTTPLQPSGNEEFGVGDGDDTTARGA